MTRPSPLGWILPSLMWTAVITLVLVQMSKPGKNLRAVEHWPTYVVVDPSEAYYGPRDTAVTRWVCCRGLGL